MAKTSTSVIVLNGHRYDAKTGKLLSVSDVKPPTTPTKLDLPKAPPPSAPKEKPRTPLSRLIKPHRLRRPQRAKTLIRNSVKRPVPAARQQVSSVASALPHRRSGASGGVFDDVTHPSTSNFVAHKSPPIQKVIADVVVKPAPKD